MPAAALLRLLLALSATLLVANDLWWKAAYPGALTGKVSDFAGLLLVGLWWGSSFPRRAVRLGGLAGLALAWIAWKSPLVDPLLAALDRFAGIVLTRVVDPTDLWALAMLPLAYVLVAQARVRPPRVRPVLHAALFGAVVTASTAWQPDLDIEQMPATATRLFFETVDTSYLTTYRADRIVEDYFLRPPGTRITADSCPTGVTLRLSWGGQSDFGGWNVEMDYTAHGRFRVEEAAAGTVALRWLSLDSASVSGWDITGEDAPPNGLLVERIEQLTADSIRAGFDRSVAPTLLDASSTATPLTLVGCE